MAIYIPTYNSNNCVMLVNQEVVRVFDQRPSYNSTITYTDYYIRSNYYSNRGYTTFSQYSTLPECRSDYTTNIYERYDFDKIITIFVSILIIFYFLAYKPISRMFGRWLKL